MEARCISSLHTFTPDSYLPAYTHILTHTCIHRQTLTSAALMTSLPFHDVTSNFSTPSFSDFYHPPPLPCNFARAFSDPPAVCVRILPRRCLQVPRTWLACLEGGYAGDHVPPVPPLPADVLPLDVQLLLAPSHAAQPTDSHWVRVSMQLIPRTPPFADAAGAAGG